MKFKLDENLGKRYARLLQQVGFDVTTVPEEQLCSASDKTLISRCAKEDRCLITFDLDFANPLIFKPSDYPGIVVLRLPLKPIPADIERLLHILIQGLNSASVTGKLWIVQSNRIREHQEE